LKAAEFESSKQFEQNDASSGGNYCWDFNANCGGSFRGAECPFGVHQMMKHSGLHWTVRAQLARRGGLKGTQLLDKKSVGGCIQSLREVDGVKENTKKGKRRRKNRKERTRRKRKNKQRKRKRENKTNKRRTRERKKKRNHRKI